MKERPILFSAPMVRAILAGTKTQTRRLVKPQPEPHQEMRLAADAPGRPDADWFLVHHDALNTWSPVRCPYGAPGDRLWVKETHALMSDYGEHIEKIAEVRKYGGGAPVDRRDLRWHGTNAIVHYREHPRSFKELEAAPYFETWSSHGPPRWRPSIFMPRWASRITLEVTGVRVERLHAITEEDARAEGVQPAESMSGGMSLPEYAPHRPTLDYRAGFAALWRQINGAESWDANPWVWVVEFKRVEAQERAA